MRYRAKEGRQNGKGQDSDDLSRACVTEQWRGGRMERGRTVMTYAGRASQSNEGEGEWQRLTSERDRGSDRGKGSGRCSDIDRDRGSD